jgi:predicted ATPase
LETPLTAVRGFTSPEHEARSGRAIVLSEKLGDMQHLYASLRGQFMYRNATGENRKARETAERCRTLSTRQGDRAMQLSTHYVMGMSLRQHGEFAAAQKEFEALLALYDARSAQPHGSFIEGRHAPGMWSLVSIGPASAAELALVLWILGYPERAAKMQAQAFCRAAELNTVLGTGTVHVNAGVRLEQLFGNVAAVLMHAEALAALMSEHGVTTWRGVTGFYKGWAVSSSDGAENGIALMQQGLAILEARNAVMQSPYFMSLLAQMHTRVGDLQPALDLCVYAQERAHRTEEHIWEAELYRIDGDVRRTAGHALTDVEECFRRALDVSRRQGARMFELRAAMSLARQWREQRRNVEARDLLAPVYGWFTEGFDTVDLKDAKALLSQLNA